MSLICYANRTDISSCPLLPHPKKTERDRKVLLDSRRRFRSSLADMKWIVLLEMFCRILLGMLFLKVLLGNTRR
jgi:hypothetical protein